MEKKEDGCDVSVIVVNYNTSQLLDRCLERLFESIGVEFQVIVVDNGSADESVSLVKRKYPEVNLKEFERNQGYAKAINTGAEMADGEVLVLVNTDTLVRPETLETLYNFVSNRDEIAAAGPVLRGEDGASQNSWAPFPTLFGELINRSLAKQMYSWTHGVDEDEPEQRKKNGVMEVPSLVGACMAISRDVWNRIHSFDTSYFVFLEETDWCKRANEAGYKIVLLPHTTVQHLQGETRAQYPARARVEFFRSLYRYFYKHYSPGTYLLFRILNPPRLAIETLLNGIGTVLTLGLKRRWKRKFYTGLWLDLWHALLCPSSMGLRKLGEDGGDEEENVRQMDDSK